MSFNPFDEFPLIPGTEALQHPLQLPEGDLGEKTRRKPRFFRMGDPSLSYDKRVFVFHRLIILK